MSEGTVKIVLLGQSLVGKTCIVEHFVTGKFNDESLATLGACYASRDIVVRGEKLSLEIWDTAGQERFRVLTPMYYREAKGVILVYSITDQTSFEDIDYWVESLRDNTDSVVSMVLVGNKSDLEDQRVISEEDGQAKAKKIGAEFMETSALNGAFISDVFTMISVACMDSVTKKQDVQETKLSTGKSGCC